MLIIIDIIMATYNPFYTHCGSTNHGMMIKWDTDDGVDLKIEANMYLQADLDTFSAFNAEAEYYINTANLVGGSNSCPTSTDAWFTTGDVCCADSTTVTCAWPQVQMLLILVNENDDCTSSMVCKDGMRAMIDVKGQMDCTSACAISSITATWNIKDTSDADVFVD